MKFTTRLRRLVALGTALVAVTGTAAACSHSTSTSSSNGTVRMALQPLWEYAPWVVAHDLGYDKAQGLDFKFTWLTQVGPEVQGMRRGDFDVVSSCTACNFAFYKSAPDLTDFMITDQYKGFIVMGRKGAPSFDALTKAGTSPDDARKQIYAAMKGKTFVLVKSVFGPLVQGMVQNAGLKASDVKIIDEPDDAKAATAFGSGVGDYFMGGTPTTTKLQADTSKYVSVGGSQVLGPAGLWYSTMTTQKSWLSKNKTTAQKMLAVWYRTMKELSSNPDKIIPAMQKVVNAHSGSDFSLAQAKSSVQVFDDFYTLEGAGKNAYNSSSDVYWKTALEYYTKQAIAQKNIDASLDIDAHNVQEEFYNEFLKNKKLVDWVNQSS